MKISSTGIDLIKHFENCHLTSYLCPANIWTIGYGHTGGDVMENIIISQEQAESLLISDLNYFEDRINSLKLPLNQNQFDALISFTFNLGYGNLLKSTLLKKAKINVNDLTISQEFMKWNKAGGKELKGLTLRRKAESDLYFKK